MSLKQKEVPHKAFMSDLTLQF